MMIRLILIFSGFLLSNFLSAKVYPKNNQVIKHLQVMYETDAHEFADTYKFYVYHQNKLIDLGSTIHPVYLGKTILEYASTYKLVVKKFKNKIILNEYTIHFKTAKNLRAQKDFSKIEITKYNKAKTLPLLILMDNNFIVNREGKIIYCIDTSLAFVRNFHMTNTGSLFYIDSNSLVETDLNGNILWKSKFLENAEFKITEYHHDMIKTKKGTYLCIASVKYKKFAQKVKYNIIVELDKKHHIKWIWHEKDYFPNDSTVFKASHINSIFYDENEESIYINNRDLHNIIKIDKKTSKPIWSLGYAFNDIPYIENSILRMEHRVIKLPNNNFLVFNNDSGDASQARTSIVEITNPGANDNRIEVVWEYKFNFDSDVENFIPRMGGAIKLKNNNYLIATGIFDRNFEITADGEIVWELRMEQYNKFSKQLSGVPCYRNNTTSSLYPFYHILYKKQNEYVLLNAGTEKSEYRVQTESNKYVKIFLNPNTYQTFKSRPIGVNRIIR